MLRGVALPASGGRIGDQVQDLQGGPHRAAGRPMVQADPRERLRFCRIGGAACRQAVDCRFPVNREGGVLSGNLFPQRPGLIRKTSRRPPVIPIATRIPRA